MGPAICAFSPSRSSAETMGEVLRISFTITSTTDLILSGIIDCAIPAMRKLSSNTIALKPFQAVVSPQSKRQGSGHRAGQTFRALIFGLLLVSLKMSMMTVESVLDG
ncbi:hypothetical protein TRVL_04762 [Trypanosoma vivax]|nr:hypothetical protein TRVL_04762 [Trypanosoma vivax]